MSNLATNQLYAEQKWVTTYLKNARNEADKESTTMQKFLTENLLILLQQVDASLQDSERVAHRFCSLCVDCHSFLGHDDFGQHSASLGLLDFSVCDLLGRECP